MRAHGVVLVILASSVFAGCASKDPEASTSPASTDSGAASNMSAPEPVTLAVATSGVYPLNPGFSPAALEAPAGALVNLTFENADPNPVAGHNWVLEGVDGAGTDVIGTGDATSITFTAPPAGEYAFYCSVGNHRQLGMEGTFTSA